jgi:hypothetical protein
MFKVRADDVETEVPRGTARHSLLAILALVAGGLATQSAPAQLAPGYSGSPDRLVYRGAEGYRTLRAFGSCYASRYPADAFSLIATEPESRDEADTYRRLFRRDSQGCLGEDIEVHARVAMVRGAIAEGLYKHGVAVPPNLIVPVPVAGAPVRTLSEAARCYTAAHRDSARALVDQTTPGSRQEYEALTAILPDFFLCIPDTARGRRFGATLIRFRLVEALLRMPSAPAGQR